MHLLYLTFGPNAANHALATFSALTFLRQRAALGGAGFRIHVFTDAPAWYRHLTDHVELTELTPAQLQEWRGEVDFFWRIKIKALEHLAARFPGEPLLYLDADTFLHGDGARHLQAPLGAGTALMHEPEGPLAALPSKTERLMWQQVRGQAFGGVTITERHAMWNAGAVGIPGARAATALPLALRLCDEMCARGVTRRLIEQFALSVALTETGPLEAARPAVGHFWSTKEAWQTRIDAFLLASRLQSRSVAADLAALADFDFRAAPVYERRRSTAAKLHRLADKLFPPTGTRYLGEE